MPRRSLLCVLVLAFVSCAPSSAPVIDVPSSSSTEDTATPGVASVTSAAVVAPPSASLVQDPEGGYIGTCRKSGLRSLEPCPGGGAIRRIEDVDQPDVMRYCCTTGQATGGPNQLEACFNVLEAALSCGDADGIRAANARILELTKQRGELCADPEFRAQAHNWPGYQRLCRMRGVPVPSVPTY